MSATTDAAPASGFILGPLATRREQWSCFASSLPCSTLYHDKRWLRVLEQSYGFELTLAAIVRGRQLAAGCVLAQTKNPFRRRMVSLPFSDDCPPLAVDPNAMEQLLSGMLSHGSGSRRYEIRGVELTKPWRVMACFADWRLDLARPLSAVQRDSATNFRRQLRRAGGSHLSVQSGTSWQDVLVFYELMTETRHRLGLPVQPLGFFRNVYQLFNPKGDFEIWSVSREGHLLASSLLLCSGSSLHLKWSARRPDQGAGANHLLFWSIVEKHAGKSAALHLGRTDTRNVGLSRFKRELGARPRPMPYSYYPCASKNASSEVLSGRRRLLSQIWCRLPLPATRAIGSVLYRYLT